MPYLLRVGQSTLSVYTLPHLYSMLPAGNNGTRGEALLFHCPSNDLRKEKMGVRLSYLARIFMIVMGMTKLSSVHLHPAKPSSIHLHRAYFNLDPAPSTSTQLISASTQLSAIPPSIFEPEYCK